jgi:hypothetical protein
MHSPKPKRNSINKGGKAKSPWLLIAEHRPPENVAILVSDGDAVWVDIFEKPPGAWQGRWQSLATTFEGIGSRPQAIPHLLWMAIPELPEPPELN